MSRISMIASPLCGLALVLAMSVSAVRADESVYRQHNLVSDGAVAADHTDADLVNAWGIAFNPNGVVWVADNGSDKSTLYDGNGVKQSLVVSIPSGAPTGIVFNSSNDFKANGSPSRFIFASENGTVEAWVPPATVTIKVVDETASGAVFKGIALAGTGTGHFIYVTDFHNSRIDVYDATFTRVTLSAGAFHDPNIPAGYGPFGIQNINGDLYVTYAKQDADRHDDVKGQGFGFVDVYGANGTLIRRVASHGQLNAPWGLALAPADFGRFSNSLLVGNFGDGTINAFDLDSGNFRGTLRGADHKPVTIDGLWGLSFGNGVDEQPANVLFFTAGPNGENDGLYGRIEAVKEKD